MKKIAFSAFLILFLIFSDAFGQIDNFGLKIGGQSAGAFSEQIEYNRVAGLGIYGFADITFAPKLFLLSM